MRERDPFRNVEGPGRAGQSFSVLVLGLAVAWAGCDETTAPEPAPEQDASMSDAGAAPAPDTGVDGAQTDGQTDAAAGPILSEEALEKLRTLSPEVLPEAPADVSNAWADDDAAAAFGQTLFFETRFSGALLDGDNDGTEFALGLKGDTGKVSCGGCHMPESGFNDTRSILQEISLAAGWVLRKTPSLLDVAHSTLLMWDGRFDSLHAQVFGPLESPLELNSSRLYAAQQMFALYRDEYEAIFGPMPPLDDTSRFPVLTAETTGCRALDANNACRSLQRGAPGDGAEYDSMSAADQDAVTRVWVNAGKAMAAYQRRLACGPSRFDAFMHGDEGALDASEQRGAALFVGKGDCVKCHSGPFMSDEKFHNLGLRPELVATVFLDWNDYGASEGLAELLESPLNTRGVYSDGDDGRLPADIPATMEGAFKTPKLRCVAERPSFMHTGHLADLEEVVSFLSRGGDPVGYLGQSELAPLDLTDDEEADLVAFLRTLDGPGPSEDLRTDPFAGE